MSKTLDTSVAGKPFAPIVGLVEKASRLIHTIAQPSLVQLVLRVGLAVPFWRSGILKWDGFLQLSDTAVELFSDEFMLHLPGGPYPYPAPAVMAFLSGSGEVVFSTLLVLGLATRFAATGLLAMTAIVELTVPDGWPVHITWAAMALGVMAWGPGRLSLDYLIGKVFGFDAPFRTTLPATPGESQP
ncbi:DoxX family protein [Rhizobium sp. LEGMi198b]|uniref:DoxX family protein n=1 Tax=Rhizobium sp. CB3060 TaxID=3138255 RepID=UPI0021A45884|nr:DoxX family protein [Rhizobium tropici]UWU24794.1 DoxX family protein [Rhizobium tropici]